MNLDNLNLVELNAQEVFQTEGGCWGCVPGGRTIEKALHELGDFFEGIYAGL